ncbi:Lsr2 family protein [Kineococcus gynurae]|uniref:Lsr2 family protein n=1 Tax=Kineococcus gynurae TaxID=452979 RepID=A0ABV5LVK6_9ACTN
MAQRTTVILTDDVDGGAADQTVRFGLDGVDYEIDLSDDNAETLRRAYGLYVEHGRRTGGRSVPAKPVAFTGVDNTAVRAWARAHGIEVPARGRIKQDVVDRYREAGH